MLKFIAADLGSSRKAGKVTLINQDKCEGTAFPWSLYLHGEIETLNGYDLLAGGEGVRDVTLPEIPCIVDIEGEEYECTLFQWETVPDGARCREQPKGESQIRGLIILKGDEEFEQDAKDKQKRRARLI